jgi:1,4-alpha-glucan branching enzyme
MPNAVAIRPVEHGVRNVVFRVNGGRIPEARSVTLVGSFNRWDTSVHQLARGSDGWWTISLSLTPGEYRYLFLVDGAPWNDPEDDGRVPCEWGGQYSVRLVA